MQSPKNSAKQELAFVVSGDIPEKYLEDLHSWKKSGKKYRYPAIVIPHEMGMALAKTLFDQGVPFVIYVVEESQSKRMILDDGRTLVRHTRVKKNKAAQATAFKIINIYK